MGDGSLGAEAHDDGRLAKIWSQCRFLVHVFDRLSPRFFTRLELLKEAPQSIFWLLLKRANPLQDTETVLMRLHMFNKQSGSWSLTRTLS